MKTFLKVINGVIYRIKNDKLDRFNNNIYKSSILPRDNKHYLTAGGFHTQYIKNNIISKKETQDKTVEYEQNKPIIILEKEKDKDREKEKDKDKDIAELMYKISNSVDKHYLEWKKK
jgi:hypothetical protein